MNKCIVYANGGMRMTESSTMTAVTFRISSDLKDRVDKLANKTGLGSSYFYNQLVADHIDELEDAYDCLEIIENVKKGKEKTVPLEKVIADYGL